MRPSVLGVLLTLAALPATAQVPYGRTPANSQQEATPPAGVDRNTLYTDVEYISGHEGFPEKVSGQLVVNADGVGFFNERGKPVFSLPASTIRNAEHTRDVRGASVGKKILFGALAGDRKQDFLTITTETESTAEGIVLKLKQNTATGVAAKIEFYARKAHGETPAAVAAAPAIASAATDPSPPTATPASTATVTTAPAPSNPVSPPVPASPSSGSHSSLRSNADLSSDVGFRLAVGDAQRLDFVTGYQEVGNGHPSGESLRQGNER